MKKQENLRTRDKNECSKLKMNKYKLNAQITNDI